jgi:hypothetical protein
MSEDANLINVEDDAPEPAPTPPAAPEAPLDPPVVASTESEDLDLNAIDVKDEARVRGLIGELSRKRAENRTLKEQATRAQQLEAELNQAKPYLDFVKNNPQLLQPRQPEPQVPAHPEADPDAVEAARLMDFYTADGKPDVERGARWLALQDKRSGRVAQQTMAPTVQQSLQDKAQANYVLLRNFKLPDGTPLRQEIVDGIWSATAREPNGMATLANPQSVQALALLAIGAHSLSTPRQPAAPARPPVVTESAGGRATTPAARLSTIEERTIAQRGMSAAQYAEHTKDFKPGVSNVLED